MLKELISGWSVFMSDDYIFHCNFYTFYIFHHIKATFMIKNIFLEVARNLIGSISGWEIENSMTIVAESPFLYIK